MSAATRDALDAAIRAHVADETSGDLVTGWALVASIVEHDIESRTTFLSTSDLAVFEIRGMLAEGDRTLLLSTEGRAR